MSDFHPGDEVRLRADPEKTGIVRSAPVVRGGIAFVRIQLIGQDRRVIDAPVDQLELVAVPVSGRERLEAGQFGSVRNLRSRLTYEKLANPLRDVLYSLKASRTEFLAYQFKPVLKFLESPANALLIADEVGLGKTIEAGYILKELRARQRDDFRRVLVVCPAGLRSKWVQELNRRFAESFEMADARRLREAAAKIESEGDHHEFALVTSYQTLRSKSVQDYIDNLGPLNLTIIDEAHHFRNPNTQTHEVAECLRELSDNMIMLSATPVQLGDQNLHALLRLLAPDLIGDYSSFHLQFKANREALAVARIVAAGGADVRQVVLDRLAGMATMAESGLPMAALRAVRERVAVADLSIREVQLELRSSIRELSPLSTLMSRTRKREVSTTRPRREATLVEVQLHPTERSVYDFFTAQSRRRYGEAATTGRSQQSSRFRSVAMQQQMASCLPAFLATRVVGPGGLVEYDDPRSIDDLDVELTEEEMAARAAAIREAEDVTSAIDQILGERIDTKFDHLLAILRSVDATDPSGKVVVFSFYKRTLAYLQRRLREHGIGVEVISGDVPSSPDNRAKDERGARVDRFHADPSVRVLLSSEVGSEGLDFQEASNVVVHYDLPWNPMKVEQRIGRIDRHGQPRSIVYTISFAIKDTLEERIRQVLYERIGVFRETIGDLEDIIGERLHDIEEVAMSPTLTETQREAELSQIADAVIFQARQREQIEEQGAVLMGHDDTFDQELSLLERSGRAVLHDEIAEFVEAALEAEGIRVVPIRGAGRRAARIDDVSRLQDFIRLKLPRGVWGRIALLNERPGTAVELDYLSTKAPHFVSVHHPLAHAAVEARKQSLGTQDEPVVSLRLPVSVAAAVAPSLAKPAHFAFCLTRLSDQGTTRDSYSIVADVVDFDGTQVDTQLGEQLVQAALVHGQDAQMLRPLGDRAQAILDALDIAAVARRGARESAIRERHQRSQEMRLQMQRSRTVTELGRIKARISSTSFGVRQSRYQNMILGRKRILEDELRKIEDAHRSPRLPTVVSSNFGFGLIEVTT
jgi:hypothetical protein